MMLKNYFVDIGMAAHLFLAHEKPHGHTFAIFAICKSGRARDGWGGWNKWKRWSQGKFKTQTWVDSLILKDFVCTQNKLENKKLHPVVISGVKLLNSFLGFMPWTQRTLEQFIVM